MTDPFIEQRIREIAGAEALSMAEPMRLHTTFRIGGNADLFVRVGSEEVLLQLLTLLRKEGIPFFILGNGSNLLVSDEGYRGVVLQMSGALKELAVNAANGEIRAGAGVLLTEAVSAAAANALDGLSFAAGIPGTIGGALVMNAGAYGAEMADVVSEAGAIDLDREAPERITLTREEMDFHYRGSVAARRHLVFTYAKLQLTPGDEQAIRARMEELTAKRREKQPLEFPSAGSAFKRPEGQFAGKLIMDAGLKGYRVGGAEVSEKHCGFIVNRGGASASDVYRLMHEVRKKVQAASGVALEPEIMLLGEFGEGESSFGPSTGSGTSG